MIKNSKKIIFGIILTIFIFVGISNSTNLINAQDLLVAQRDTSLIESDLIVLLLEIKSIKLEEDVFDNKVFKSLKDFGTEIKPQPVGRKNPFSAIGFDDFEEIDDVIDTDLD